MGKRTRFQQSSMPQLVLKVERLDVGDTQAQVTADEGQAQASDNTQGKGELLVKSSDLPKVR